MLVRNYAKPFCIAGFVLAEIYMLFVMLAPPGHDHSHALPMPPMIDAGSLAPGAPVPFWHLAGRILAGAVFFGPLGALVGLGLGLLFSALVQACRRKG